MNASHSPSNENTGLRAVIGAMPVTGRCVLSFNDADPELAAAHERDQLAIARQREVARIAEPAAVARRLRAGRRRTVHKPPSLREQDLVRRHPRKRVDVGSQDVGIERKVGERTGALPGRDDEQVLLAPRVPEKRDRRAVGRPRRTRWVFDLRDAIDGDAAAGRVDRKPGATRLANSATIDRAFFMPPIIAPYKKEGRVSRGQFVHVGGWRS